MLEHSQLTITYNNEYYSQDFESMTIKEGAILLVNKSDQGRYPDTLKVNGMNALSISVSENKNLD
jgi:hypothetical protein